MAELAALRVAAARARFDRRRVQRRGGQRVPRLGRQRHARKRPRLDGDRGLAVTRGRGARRLPKVGRRMGVALARDRDVGARRRCVPHQRRRPLLLVQVVADGRARTGRARCTCDRGARRQPRRPRRSSARTARRERAGRGVPVGRRRLHEGRRACVVEDARAAHVGQARRGLPRVARAVRDRGDGRRARARRTGRAGSAPARVP